MNNVTPQFIEQARRDIERWNEEESKMCPICARGKLYRAGEPFPHVIYDVSTLHEDFPGHLVVKGECNSCGESSTFGFFSSY